MRSILVFVALAVTLSAQASRPTFEVASVKKQTQRIASIPAGLFTPSPVLHWTNATIASMLLFAYNVNSYELIGGPDWIRTDLFEINARAASEVSEDEKRLMVQSLLEDRFKQVVRKDKQEMRISELTLARSDGRLGPNVTACPDPNAPVPRSFAPRGGQRLVVGCGTIAEFARAASLTQRSPFVDRTGVTGTWHFEITFIDPRFAALAGGAQTPPIDPNLTDLGTAMREQLGLKIESKSGPVDVLVVESAQQPTPD
jgi:uncharacterized protein (TIGR03435 family)